MITALRSLVFMLIFYSGSLLLVLAALAVAWPWPAGVPVVATAWGRFHRFCARWILGQKVRIEGELPLGHNLYIVKHESMF